MPLSSKKILDKVLSRRGSSASTYVASPATRQSALTPQDGQSQKLSHTESVGSTSIDQPVADLPTDRRGLFQIACPKSGIDVAVDIVAVHGLMGDPYLTWTENDKLWLRDFLPYQLPNARIVTFGYNSSVAFSKSVAGVDDFARDLLLRLELERTEASSRPLLFICHSLGGIVVKKALVIAHEESPNNFSDIVENVKGIAFLGVPHRGASIARLGGFFAKLLKYSTLGRTTNASLLVDLEQGSHTLRDISSQAIHRLENLQVLSFFERETTWGELIVDAESARLQIPKERAIPVEANHRTICRFSSQDNQNYKLVGGYIVRLAKEAIGVSRSFGVQTSSAPTMPVKAFEFTEKEEKCIQTLYSSNYTAVRRQISKPFGTTCQWILEADEFQTLCRGTYPDLFLWITGSAGCGKTVIASWLIDVLSSSSPQSSTILFFFCHAKFNQRNTAQGLLQALIHQIIEKQPCMIEHVTGHVRNKGLKSLEHLSVLWDILLDCVNDSRSSKFICILDGLDECEPSGREELLSYLNCFQNQATHCQLRVIITSRSDVGLEDSMPTRGLLKIDLGNARALQQVNADISEFISITVESSAATWRWPATAKTSLKDRLNQNADRTFLWAAIVLDLILHKEDLSYASFNDLLTDIPYALDEVYNEILKKVDPSKRPKALEMLSIFLAAQRPLDLEEVNIIWSITPEETSIDTLEDRLQLDMSRTIRLLCGQFVRIIDGDCFLVHQSARAYLLKTPFWDTTCMKLESANLLLGQRCIDYLDIHGRSITDLRSFLGLADEIEYLSFDFPPMSWMRYRLEKYCKSVEFLPYALKWWAHHYREAQVLPISRNLALIRRILRVYRNDLIQFDWWLSVDWTTRVITGYRSTSSSYPFGMFGLCSHNGHHVVAEHLIKFGQNINESLSPFGFTALHLAVMGQQAEMSSWLLNHGADVEAEDADGETPILAATLHGDVEVLRILLESGANTECEDSRGSTALMRSLELGSKSQVEILLLHDAFIHASNALGQHPVHIAATSPNASKITLLIQHGANIHVLDRHLRSPLHIAVESGSMEVAMFLLEHGINPRFKDLSNRTALNYSIHNKDVEMTKLLLNNGIEVDIVSMSQMRYYGDGSLEDVNAFQSLLVDISAVYSEGFDTRNVGSSLLCLAVINGSVDQVSYLLDMGLNPNVEHKAPGLTPLIYAIYLGHQSIVFKLLTHGSQLIPEAGNGLSPLSLAIALGKPMLVKMLLSWGADPLRPTCCPIHLPIAVAQSSLNLEILETVRDSLYDITPRLWQDVRIALTQLFNQAISDVSRSCGEKLEKDNLCLETRRDKYNAAKQFYTLEPENLNLADLLTFIECKPLESFMGRQESINDLFAATSGPNLKAKHEDSSPPPVTELRQEYLRVHDTAHSNGADQLKPPMHDENDSSQSVRSRQYSLSGCSAVKPTISTMSDHVVRATDIAVGKAMSVASAGSARSSRIRPPENRKSPSIKAVKADEDDHDDRGEDDWLDANYTSLERLDGLNPGLSDGLRCAISARGLQSEAVRIVFFQGQHRWDLRPRT